ncbi:MAG TPA: hypothetical protein DC059_08625 [Dietzia sp.]|nr:hypothetical protein [Dietzia sp.]
MCSGLPYRACEREGIRARGRSLRWRLALAAAPSPPQPRPNMASRTPRSDGETPSRGAAAWGAGMPARETPSGGAAADRSAGGRPLTACREMREGPASG